MLRFQEKKTFRRYLYSRVFLSILGVLILFLAHAVYGVYRKAQSAGVFLQEAETTLEEMNKREKYFSREIERLDSDLGVEEEIRKKFQVAKEGEKVIVIMDEGKNTTEAAIEPKETFWQNFLSIIQDFL